MAKRSRDEIRDELISWQIELSDRRDARRYKVTAADKRRIASLCDQLIRYTAADCAKLNSLRKATAKPPKKRLSASVANCSAQQTALDIALLEQSIANDVKLMKDLAVLLAQMALAMCQAGM